MERSFARGTRYGFDRARWRGIWRVQIQEYLISAIQNIQVLLKYGHKPKKSLSAIITQAKGTVIRVIRSVSDRMKGLLINEINRIMPAGLIRIEYVQS
jgi:hypothetical protein